MERCENCLGDANIVMVAQDAAEAASDRTSRASTQNKQVRFRRVTQMMYMRVSGLCFRAGVCGICTL